MSVNLGSIYASVQLKLDEFNKGQAQVRAGVAEMSGSLAKLDAGSYGAQLGAGMLNVGKVLGGVSAAAAIASASAVKLAADYDASMTKISNNTTMTTADMGKMRAAVLAMGRESGASFDELGEGFAHITNFGFKAADATTILHEAMKSAVATGTSAADTANILANVLHEFSMSATDAGKAMNVLHLAAAQGNMTLQQFDDAAGPALAEAANLGVSLTDVAAAMSALTRHGLDASEAATQVKDILIHIINPSKQAREEIALLAKTTGVDLSNDFSLAGLKARGFTGFMNDLIRATHGNGQEIYKLIQAQRGGLGAMILAGTGAKDYTDILGTLNDAMSGKIDPTTKAYNDTLKTLNNEVARLTNEVKADFIPVGEKLIPVFRDAIPLIRSTASGLSKLLDDFTGLPKPIQQTVIAVGALSVGIKALDVGLGVMGGAGLTGGLKTVGEKLSMKIMPGTLGALLTGGASGVVGAGLAVGGLAAVLGEFASYMNAGININYHPDYSADNKPSLRRNAASIDAQVAKDMSQAERNRDAAFGILSSPQYKQVMAEIANPKAFGVTKKDALAAKGKMDRDELALMLDAKKLDADSHKMRLSEATGGSALAEAMAKHVGEATGIQCGAAVTKALREAGFGGTATALAKSAIANPKNRLHPNSAGEFPPGTIIFFPGKGGAVGSDPSEHFGVAGGASSLGQRFFESTTAGGRGRHYRDDRTIAQVIAQHGGHYIAFAPGAASAGKASASLAAVGGGAAVDPKALSDLQQRLYEATHKEFDNKRYEAKQTYLTDKETNPAEAQKLYRVTLANIAADEAKARAEHYKQVESAWQGHMKRLDEILSGRASNALSAMKPNPGIELPLGVLAHDKAVAKAGVDLGSASANAQVHIISAGNSIAVAMRQAAAHIAGHKAALADAGALFNSATYSADVGFKNVTNAAGNAANPAKGKKGKGQFDWIGQSMIQNIQVSMQHWNSFKGFFSSLMQGLKDIFVRAVTEMAAKWAILKLAGASGKGLGGIFSGALGQGGAGGASGLGSIGGLFGKGAPLGGILGGGIAKAIPWVGAGLAINSLLGNPLKKIFHFSSGGLVPGSGFRDSVPALLTPGERVLTRGQQAASGAPHITINHYGDNHGAGDVTAMHRDWAFGIKSQLPVATPGV